MSESPPADLGELLAFQMEGAPFDPRVREPQCAGIYGTAQRIMYVAQCVCGRPTYDVVNEQTGQTENDPRGVCGPYTSQSEPDGPPQCSVCAGYCDAADAPLPRPPKNGRAPRSGPATTYTARLASAQPGALPTSVVSDEVLAVLRRATVEGRLVRLPQTPRLAPDLYQRVDAVLRELGGKWESGRTQAHVFATDPAAALARLLATGQITTAADLAFFETPQAIAREVVRRARVAQGMRVLEPSAGDGALVAELLAAGATVVAVELDPRRAQRLRERFPSAIVHEGDFLALSPVVLGVFDAVAMNPPFSVAGHPDAEVEHVLHAARFLAPAAVRNGGRLASVMSTAPIERASRACVAFRAEVERQGGTLEELPPRSFQASGTDLRTALAVLPCAG